MTKQAAIAKLERIAAKLIPANDPNLVSRAFGYGRAEQDSRAQAGIICQNLANQLWEETVNQ